MRIRVLSDLHLEHHRDGGRSFVASLDPRAVDVLVVAGDLAVGDGVGPALDLLCERFDESVVVYVHGNHEVYGTTLDLLRAELRSAERRQPRLRWLDCGAVSVGGVRFLGAPLWFSRPPDVELLRSRMIDFSAIPELESWVYAENERARAFFDAELREGDVCVTHHLPNRSSVAPRWIDSPLNAFFVCDLDPLIQARAPALWIHGHTHDSVDVVIHGRTRVVCNPFGYVRMDENSAFDPDKTIELG
jgi:Icc-related predicted phosphoesterase